MKVILKKTVYFILIVLLLCIPASVSAEGAQKYKFTKVSTAQALTWQNYFSSGMHLVYKGFDECYYVTKEGKLVKPHPNIVGRSYSDGLTPVYDKNKGLGYVDTNGNVVIPMNLPVITSEDGEVLYAGYFVDRQG